MEDAVLPHAAGRAVSVARGALGRQETIDMGERVFRRDDDSRREQKKERVGSFVGLLHIFFFSNTTLLREH